MGRIYTPGIVACVMQFFTIRHRANSHFVNQDVSPDCFAVYLNQTITLVVPGCCPFPTTIRQHFNLLHEPN